MLLLELCCNLYWRGTGGAVAAEFRDLIAPPHILGILALVTSTVLEADNLCLEALYWLAVGRGCF